MREIKFRAWYKPQNEMVDSKRLESINFEVKTIGAYIVKDGKGFNKLRTSDFELMQFTGLKDKNGKEIYEGDVIDVKDEGFPFVKDWIGIVKFIEGSYLIENLEGTDGEYLFDELREIEVIGNIYENADISELALAPSLDSNT